MEPHVKKALKNLTDLDDDFFSLSYLHAMHDLGAKAMEVVCNYLRRRSQTDLQNAGIWDTFVRAPNYYQGSKFRKVRQGNGLIVWIHIMPPLIYDLRLLSPAVLDILVPELARFASSYDPENPKNK